MYSVSSVSQSGHSGTSLETGAEKIKDLEHKVANLFMDNVSLTTKLKASRAVETEHKECISNLEEQLVQALKKQVLIHTCTSPECADAVL